MKKKTFLDKINIKKKKNINNIYEEKFYLMIEKKSNRFADLCGIRLNQDFSYENAPRNVRLAITPVVGYSCRILHFAGDFSPLDHIQ